MTYRPGSLLMVLSLLLMFVWSPALAPCQAGDNPPPAAGNGAEDLPEDQAGGAAEDKTADEAPDWQTEIDDFFGDYLVVPLHKVLFFDFWSPQWLRTEILDEVPCSNKEEKCKHKIVPTDFSERTLIATDAAPKDGQLAKDVSFTLDIVSAGEETVSLDAELLAVDTSDNLDIDALATDLQAAIARAFEQQADELRQALQQPVDKKLGRSLQTQLDHVLALAPMVVADVADGHLTITARIHSGIKGLSIHTHVDRPASARPLGFAEQQALDELSDAYPIVLVCPECRSETATGVSVPLVVVWLFVGAVFFTLRMRFINVRAFCHGVRLIRGDYDDPNETGEVSHFQALASALSATIGLGNIAGVAIAVGVGGPGAVFWMVLAGVIGMSSKFAECTLSQMYRKISPDGTVSGGPMHYLHAGLKDLRPDSVWVGSLGRILAIVFAVLCVGASFGGGCAFQVVQSLNAVREDVSWLNDYPWVYGLIMAFMVGIVIIGGIRRIAATAEKIVPLMCCVYVVTTLYILLTHFSLIGWAFDEIFRGAFTPEAGLGGILGVMVLGMRRAAFSNEAGVGSAAIAHAAAKTEEPIREGIVASLGPFIDTVIICTMTGLAIIVTDVHKLHPEMIGADGGGAALTVEAFRTVGDWFPYILYVAVVLFAYSTMISWSYYGERCWSHLFGSRTSLIYKLIFLVFVVLGSIVNAKNILDFSDLMILAMAFPNILGVALLSGKIRERLDDYWKRYKSGEMEPHRNR